MSSEEQAREKRPTFKGKVGQIERVTQVRAVKLFSTPESRGGLGYQYLGNWEEREGNSNIETEIARTYLEKRGYGESLITKALYELNKAAGNQ